LQVNPKWPTSGTATKISISLDWMNKYSLLHLASGQGDSGTRREAACDNTTYDLGSWMAIQARGWPRGWPST
jgi:hypothetical protein